MIPGEDIPAGPVYTDEQRAEGLTKARLIANLSRAADEQFADDAAYSAYICAAVGLEALPIDALDSYAAQHEGRSVAELAAELATKLAGDEPAPEPQPEPPAPSDPLEAAKQARRAEINRVRRALENGTAPTPLGAVQCDNDSRNKINGAVLMAMLSLQAGEPFAVGWTMADNATVVHDAMAMIGMGKAVGVYIATLHAIGVALKTGVDACASVAEVEAINPYAGWPG